MPVKQMEREDFLDFIENFDKTLIQICEEASDAETDDGLSIEKITEIIKRGEEKILEYDDIIKQLSSGQLDRFKWFEKYIIALKEYLTNLNKKL